MTATQTIEDGYVVIRFDGDPSADQKALMQSNGFGWYHWLGGWIRTDSEAARKTADWITEGT